ncbi:MAG: carboxypeptidase-like regulatory domain-containing protein, partial [Longimicrobiales bacterium]
MFIVLPAVLAAQEARTVSGKVTVGPTNVPQAGVQILVKGTNVGTLTDAQGNFTLRVPVTATTLVFTSLGYRTVEAAINNQVAVNLVEQPIGLE